MTYALRPATAADEPFLLEMLDLASNWREGAPPNPVDTEYAAGFGRPGDIGVIAEGAGAAWCRLRTSDNPGYGWGKIALRATRSTQPLVPVWRSTADAPPGYTPCKSMMICPAGKVVSGLGQLKW